MLISAPFLKMRFLDCGSLPDLLSLQAIIAENLTCPEVFLVHDEEFFREVLCQPNSAIGIFAREELVAYSILRIPGCCGQAEPDNLGRDINLPQKDLKKVAHLQAIAVHPSYRGNGLQKRLARAHLRVAEDLGYLHICCTVSPSNPISLANMLSCGLLVEALHPKFKGWWRFILHKDLKKPHPFLAAGSEGGAEQTAISITDLEGQMSLLQKGFKGFKIEVQSDITEVFYERAASMTSILIDAD